LERLDVLEHLDMMDVLEQMKALEISLMAYQDQLVSVELNEEILYHVYQTMH
jgi:hypothetical protein